MRKIRTGAALRGASSVASLRGGTGRTGRYIRNDKIATAVDWQMVAGDLRVAVARTSKPTSSH